MSKEDLPRKDIVGRELKIGDTVAFNPPRYKGLTIGDIIRFSPKGVRIAFLHQNRPQETNVAFNAVCKVNE